MSKQNDPNFIVSPVIVVDYDVIRNALAALTQPGTQTCPTVYLCYPDHSPSIPAIPPKHYLMLRYSKDTFAELVSKIDSSPGVYLRLEGDVRLIPQTLFDHFVNVSEEEHVSLHTFKTAKKHFENLMGI